MDQKIIIVLVATVILVVLVVAYMYPGGNVEPTTYQKCTNSGGIVTTMLCCNSVNDFPNTCLIGACGCGPDNSHEVNFCQCPEGKCFDGNACVSPAMP